MIVRPLLHTVSSALVLDVIAVEGTTVGPRFSSNTLLGSLFELSHVLEVVDVHADTRAMVLVVGPFAFIGLSLHLSELSVAMCNAEVPGALVRSAIPEAHDTASMAESSEPLTVVGCAARAVPMDSDCQLFVQLCLIRVEQDAQLNYPSLAYRLELVLNHEVRLLLPKLFSLFEVSHASDLGFPVGLNLDDPGNVGLEIVVELVARIVSHGHTVLDLH